MSVKKCKKARKEKEEGGKTAMEKDARGKALSVISPGVKILLTAIMVLLLSFEANAIYYYISLRAGCLGEHAPKIKSGSPIDGKVYDKDGILIPVDYCVQYIYAGPDETIELPQKDGSVAATDVLLTNNSTENFGKVGYDTYNGYFGSTTKGTLPEPGMFYHQVTNIIAPPDSGNNPRIYVRVWNAKTPAEATRYAQSAAIVVPMGEDTPPIPKEAPLPKMTTDLDKPTDDPKAPLLVLDPSGSITFNATVGVNPSFTTVKLKNTGTADLVKWSVSKTSTWLKISPVTGSLAMGAETIMVISAEVGGLPANNTYTDDIVFQSDGGNPKINVVLNIKESTAPAISKVDPKTNVNPGQTIVITGTKFGTYASNATTNVKIGGVTANPAAWSESSITLSVPKGVSSSAGVVVTANGSSSPYPITVNTSEVVIEDVEGGAVDNVSWTFDYNGDGSPDSGSYLFNKTNTDVSFGKTTTTFYEGKTAFVAQYSYNSTKDLGWGSTLTNPLDISSMNMISFEVKGDGTANTFSLKLRALYKGVEIQFASPAISLAEGSKWKEFDLKLNTFETQDANGIKTKVDPADLTGYYQNIIGYNIAYLTTVPNSFNAVHYIDGIKAHYIKPNTPPVAKSVVVSTDLNKEVEITLNGTDAEKSPLTYHIVTLPANGGALNVGIGPISGDKVKFTPKKDATGADTFTYKVNDGTDDSNTATVTVNIANNAPTPPALSEPAKDATDIAVKPTFKWDASTDPDGDTPIHYTLKVSEASDLSSPVIDEKTDAANYTAGSNLKYNTPYYWQVTADDGKGGSANSETWSFTTEDSLKVTGVLPAEATLGQTIVISGTNLGTSGTVTVGGVTSNQTVWNTTQIILAVPSGVTAGAAEVVVTSADGLYSSKGSVTVLTDSIMLDDFEGGAVGSWDLDYNKDGQPDSGRYVFDKHDPAVTTSPKTSTSYPTAEIGNVGSSNGMKVIYSYGSRTGDPDYANTAEHPDWGGGWGAKLANTYDLSAFNRIKLSIKWDGSANASAVSFELKDADGTSLEVIIPASKLNSSIMSDVVVKTSSFKKDSNFDWKNVAGYNIIYKGTNASSNYQYVDNLQAFAVDETKPELSVTPDSMSFTGYVNGDSTSPATLPITISNTMPDTGEFKFSLAATAAWIVLPIDGITSGLTAQAIVDIDEKKMPVDEGTYTAEVTVTAEDGVQGSPQKVLVTLQVKKTTSPTITSLSTTSAPAGARITISGMYFGASQEQSRVTFTRNGVAGPDGRVISWSDTQIVVETPGTLAVGGYNIEILKLSIAAEGIKIASKSDPMAYNVSAASVIGLATIYPNPINPNKAETTTILFDNQGVNNITVYIYDATARLIKQENLSAGANQTTWNGKDASGSVAGDGVYLVRIVNRDSRSLIARGKILVVKR